MKINVYGFGCECQQRLYLNVESAINILGIEADIIKISDNREIAEAGFNNVPGLAIDDDPVVTGKVLSTDELMIIFNRYFRIRV